MDIWANFSSRNEREIKQEEINARNGKWCIVQFGVEQDCIELTEPLTVAMACKAVTNQFKLGDEQRHYFCDEKLVGGESIAIHGKHYTCRIGGNSPMIVELEEFEAEKGRCTIIRDIDAIPSSVILDILDGLEKKV